MMEWLQLDAMLDCSSRLRLRSVSVDWLTSIPRLLLPTAVICSLALHLHLNVLADGLLVLELHWVLTVAYGGEAR